MDLKYLVCCPLSNVLQFKVQNKGLSHLFDLLAQTASLHHYNYLMIDKNLSEYPCVQVLCFLFIGYSLVFSNGSVKIALN